MLTNVAARQFEIADLEVSSVGFGFLHASKFFTPRGGYNPAIGAIIGAGARMIMIQRSKEAPGFEGGNSSFPTCVLN